MECTCSSLEYTRLKVKVKECRSEEVEVGKSGEFLINGRERKYASYLLCMGWIWVLTLGGGGGCTSNQLCGWRKRTGVIIYRYEEFFFCACSSGRTTKNVTHQVEGKIVSADIYFWSHSDVFKPRIFVMFRIWFCDILSVSRALLLIRLQSVKYCLLKISSSLSAVLDLSRLRNWTFLPYMNCLVISWIRFKN